MESETREDTISRYLLGDLSEDEMRRVEERLMTDNEFSELALLVENRLVDDYLDGALKGLDRERFEKLFLSTPQGREQVRFTRALKEYAARVKASESAITSRKPGWLSARWAFATAVILLVMLGFGVWRAVFYRSNIDKGLSALRNAYAERPIESRIDGLSYMAFTNTRGGQAKVDYVSRDQAYIILSNEVQENPGADSYHALGQFYLTEREFDKAIDQFQKAMEADPDNARILNDLGAAYLEKAKAEPPDLRFEYLGKSVSYLSKAIEIDDSLLEALFNRALAHMESKLREKAGEDLQKYLEKDPNSPWADEVREKLRNIASEQDKISQQEGMAGDDFLIALEAGDDEKAWQILRSSRDVISGKLIWEQLAASSLDDKTRSLKDEARLKLLGLVRAGKLESQRTGDPFVSELAQFYMRASPRIQTLLADAHHLIAMGRARYLEAEYELAAGLFSKASEQFERAGDFREAELARLRKVHCHLQKAEAKESLSILDPLVKRCEKQGYLWLLAHAFNSLARAQYAMKETSKYIEYVNQAQKIFEKMGDRSAIQKCLAELAFAYGEMGNHEDAVEYLGQCMILCGDYWPGARQAWRNYDTASMVLVSMGMPEAASSYGEEALRLALEKIKDPSFTYLSFARLGNIYGKYQGNDKAIRFAQQGLATGLSLPAENDRAAMVAFSSLQLGRIYRMNGDFPAALAYYDQAIALCESRGFEVYLYESHKGRLLCYISQHDADAAREEMAITLNLFERYRSKILEEASRNTLSHQEQDVYDIAIDFENDPQRAFEFSENSRARSLLAMLNSPARVAERNNKPEIISPSESQPLTAVQIMEKLPVQAQILQYAVRQNKLLMWVVSGTGLSALEESITLDELNRKASRLQQLISVLPQKKTDSDLNQAADLYNILIRPVEKFLDPQKLLCIVPDKFLNQFPFGALFSTQSDKRLVEMYTLMTSPSSTVFLRQTENARQKESAESERALGVGDPKFDSRAFNLPALQSAEKEVRQLTRYYLSPVILTGEDAREERVKREMEASHLIHFATHYMINNRNARLSGLLLADEPSPKTPDADGMLRYYEIFSLDLRRARLVVLAACQTGVDRIFNGEGAVGLSRAFIAAGIPIVAASLWPVDSNATAELMMNFHKYRKEAGLSSVEALCQAQRDMIEGSHHRYNHPYYWASFAIIGGYAEF